MEISQIWNETFILLTFTRASFLPKRLHVNKIQKFKHQQDDLGPLKRFTLNSSLKLNN